MQTTDELEWDLSVDFVCVGAGAGGLAAAIAAVDTGGSVFIAKFGRSLDRGGLIGTLGFEFADGATNGYLASLTEDLDRPAASLDGVPVLVAGDIVPVTKPGRRDRVPPFYGGRLGDWAAECAASPFGVACTRIMTDAATPKRLRSGSTVEFLRIGTVELDPDASAATVDSWLASAADERAIDVTEHTLFQRLVFEDGEVVGAVFDTPTATLAVAARHGVMLACDGDPAIGATPLTGLPDRSTTAEVCMVREPLSRFGRLELHVSESSVQACVAARGSR